MKGLSLDALAKIPGVTFGPTVGESMARANAEQRALDAAPASEKSFMAEVIALAKGCGWRIYHTHDSRKSEAGFPDLLLLRGDRCLVAELKVGRNRPTAAQLNWIEAFAAAGVESFVWYPQQMVSIVEILR